MDVAIIKMVTVAFLWGVTNPFLRKGSLQTNNSELTCFPCSYLKRLVLFLNWRCLLPFALNQCGSIIYMITLGSLHLSITVPVVNGLTLLITVWTAEVCSSKAPLLVSSEDYPVSLHSSEFFNPNISIDAANLISASPFLNAENVVSHKALMCNSTSALYLNSDAKIIGSKSELDTRTHSKQNLLHHIAVLNSYNQQRNTTRKRIILLQHKIPCQILSIIPYIKKVSSNEKRLTTTSTVTLIDDISFNGNPVSFSHLLVPEGWRLKGIPPEMFSEYGYLHDHINPPLFYDPLKLDDPELILGKHRTVLNLPSCLVSIIQFAKPSELKKDINERFRERFPQVTITLTKLRSLKSEIIEIGKKCNLELSVIAYSFVYFEKVILKSRVTKHNRKYIAGSCLLLALKFQAEVQSKDIKHHIENIAEQFRLNARDLLACEVQVLILLEFALMLPLHETLPICKR
ncbi:CDK5 and ABL1 enzyme substrate 1 isoform X5 [Hydra vulgaris]